MAQNVLVASVGTPPFANPGASKFYVNVSASAMRLALADAGLDYRAIQGVANRYVYGDSTCGQAAIYEAGMPGIPILNVTYGGTHVINPSSGHLSKGHPLGAPCLVQCSELVQQLRGEGGVLQVEDACLAFRHNLGLGGTCAATLYQNA